MLAVYEPAEAGSGSDGGGRNPPRHRHNEVVVAGSGKHIGSLV
jgi:hypothetical protein